MSKRLTLLVLLVVLLAACQPGPQPVIVGTVSQSQPSPIPPTDTTVPTETPTRTPTPTRVPPTATPTATRTPEPKAYGPKDFPEGINPLTGLPVTDLALLDRRPVAVKVQMFPRGERPPYGVSLADIVFDFYQNLGATRFNAIFYGQDAERVSPIRSGRLFDAPIINMYHALFAFGHADSRIYQRMANSMVSGQLLSSIYVHCPPLCRVDPNGYNFLSTNTAEITKYAEEKGIDNTRPNLDGMSFDPETPTGGSPADQVFVRFNFSNYNRWDYDPESGRYLRFQETQNDENGQGEAYAPLLDGMNEQQIAADNVVVLFIPHSYDFNTHPGKNEIVEITMTGSGTAYAFRDGQGYELRWNRPALDAVPFLTYPDGTPYPYKPGNTWYQVFGQSSKVEKPTGSTGAWRFTFAMP